MSDLIVFNRTISQTLEAWRKAEAHLPLIIRGARQVGKTASVRELARRHFDSLVELNFERNPRLADLFTADLDPRRIVSTLEALFGVAIIPGETLLFFDEIQECPAAITALRYFAEELPALHVIAAGSLLEFALASVSVPVGRVRFLSMWPLSFSEFLGATERSALAAQMPRLGALATASTLVLPVAAALRDAMREYWLVGGMPAAVAAYARERSYAAAAEVLDGLLETYIADIRKYARGEKQVENAGEVLRRLIKYVGKQVTYTEIGAGDDVKRTKRSLQLLEQARLVAFVRSVQPAGLPLGAEVDDSRFKCIFLDIGLGQRAAGIPARELLEAEDMLDAYQGKLAEQFVGQQLLAESASASEDEALYCWIRAAKSSAAEVDFVIVRDGAILPVEVKSGASGRLRSLHLFLGTYGGRGVCVRDVLSVSRDETIDFVPLFTVL